MAKARWYEVSYQLDYVHEVTVGVRARDEAAAIRKAEKAFDNATIWDDTEAMPLLYDDFEEVDSNPLTFTAKRVDTLSAVSHSVRAIRYKAGSDRLVRMLAKLTVSTEVQPDDGPDDAVASLDRLVLEARSLVAACDGA